MRKPLINGSLAWDHWVDQVVEMLCWGNYLLYCGRDSFGATFWYNVRRLLRRWSQTVYSGINWNERFRLGTRNNFFVVRTARQQNRLPREAVQYSSLEVFRTWLDQPGLTLKLTLLWTGGWTRALLRYIPSWVFLLILVSCCSSRLLCFLHCVKLRTLVNWRTNARKGEGIEYVPLLVCLSMESAIFLLNISDCIREKRGEKRENLSILILLLSTCSINFWYTFFPRYNLYKLADVLWILLWIKQKVNGILIYLVLCFLWWQIEETYFGMVSVQHA